MKNNLKTLILVCLVMIEILSLFLTYKSFSNKEIKPKEETYEVNKKQFSMFIETDNGYEEYIDSNVFPEGYTINLENSKCLDTKGNVIEGILSGTGTNITVKSNKTSYCYLYFDEKLTAAEYLIENVSSEMLWKSTLEEDGYRYVGTNPDNYICFGFSDASTDCDLSGEPDDNFSITNTDLYAYRIIGIFEDESGEQHLKLIKKEALQTGKDTTYAWNTSLQDTDWSKSTLYKGLNGSYFMESSRYSYMQDSNWTDKIATWKYIATNTLTNESSGLNYSSESAENVYLHETNRYSKTSSVGEWEPVGGKISLMYVSDYKLSNGWIDIENNWDAMSEWTMSRYGGVGTSTFHAWYIKSGGGVSYNRVTASLLAIRPVFYLESDIELSGEGTTTNPYIITN